MAPKERPNILVVDDELGPRESLGMILKPSFNVYSSEDGKQALQIIKNTNVDIVTLDLKMPVMSGEEVLKRIKAYDPTIEVVIITGYGTLKSAVEAIKYNVFDYILKPFNVSDILATVKRCLERREMSIRMKGFLEEIEKERKSPIKMYKHISQFLTKLDEIYDPGKTEGYLDFVRVLASTLENDDHHTKGHAERVNKYALMMAEGLRLSESDRNNLRVSAYLHDIGKVGMPLKNGALDEHEWATMKEHPEKGKKLVSPLRLPNEVVAGIMYHHERIDGAGYPEAMKGKHIPLFARIIAIADAFDAITVGRSYRAAISKNDALLELEQNAGSQFDKELVDIFIKKMRKK